MRMNRSISRQGPILRAVRCVSYDWIANHKAGRPMHSPIIRNPRTGPLGMPQPLSGTTQSRSAPRMAEGKDGPCLANVTASQSLKTLE